MVNHSSTNDRRRNGDREVYYSGPEASTPRAGLEGQLRSQGKVLAERGRIWSLGFVRVLGGVFWGSGAKARSVNSNQKSGVSLSSIGALTKGHTSQKPWR